MTAKNTVRQMIEKMCLRVGPEYTLSTGEKSNFYFDCKKITLDGKGLALISKLMLEKIDQLPITPVAIGGLTMGADFIAAGVILMAHQTGRKTVSGSIVRKEAKRHGTKNKIENQLAPSTPIVVIDDVVTSGGSTLTACQELESEGYKIVGIIALVDRESGGLEKIGQKYKNVSALFYASDFPDIVKQRNSGSHQKAAVG